jgi:hypothetical protein
MATSSQMLLGGIAFFVCTFTIAVSAIWGGAIWVPIMVWYYSVPYSKAPPIDPGIVTWIPSLYFAVLVAIWFALLAALVYMVMNRREYG